MPSILDPFHPRAAATLPPDWLAWLGQILAGAAETTVARPDADWRSVWPAIADHGLAPLLYTTLRDAPAAGGLPAEAFAALTTAFQANATRTLRIELELLRITAALAAHAVPCLLLKGAALGRTVYPSPAERPISDVDLLVPRASLAVVQQRLADLDYTLLSPTATGWPGCWLYRYKAELVAVGCGANAGLLVEAHWTLVELPYYIERIDIAEAWRQAQPAPGLPQAQIADPAVLLVHACAHLALHHSRDLRLIWLVDLHRLVCGAALHWPRVLHLADAWGLGLAVGACLAVANRWLGTPAPAEVRQELARLAADPAGRAMWGLGDERLPGRWWRRAGATWAAFDARQRARYAAWLAFRAAQQPAAWLRSRLR